MEFVLVFWVLFACFWVCKNYFCWFFFWLVFGGCGGSGFWFGVDFCGGFCVGFFFVWLFGFGVFFRENIFIENPI